MRVSFQSLRSSSAGNCLALWTRTSSILIDCGIRAQRDCRALLEEHARRAGHLDAVFVSHAHGDHAAAGALKVLARERIPVVGDASVIRQVRARHAPDDWKERPALHAFGADGRAFEAGDFHVTAVPVPHAPGVPTFGFVITAGSPAAARTIVICTDLHDWSDLAPRFAGADVVFLEANHDLALLRQHPNPNSRYHLSNAKAAALLHHLCSTGRTPPRAVMLGHLSEERNRRALAIGEVTRMFERQGTKMRFRLDAAPARTASAIVEICS